MLQNELAANLSGTSGLARLIWLPSGTDGNQPQQKKYIQQIHTRSELQLGADLLTGNLEQFKAAIHHRIENLAEVCFQKSEPVESLQNAQGLVYLICVEEDRKPSRPLRRYLNSQGFQVKLPAFSGDAGSVRQANREVLQSCDAALIFYGYGDEAWKLSVDTDIKKSVAYRSERPPLIVTTYLAAPSTEDKEDLIEMEEPCLIDGTEGFAEHSLDGFLHAVRGVEGQ
jgi:hypothetical protein